MRVSAKKSASTRLAILRSARDLFDRHGFHAVSLDAVMAGAGLTRGGFYKYFNTKGELFAETVKLALEDYALSDFRLTVFGQTTALLTYRAAQDTVCGTQKVPSPVWATSLYIKREGRWVNALYSHTAID